MQRKGTQKFRRLAVLNRRIVRLSSELETLQYLQDRLERELGPGEHTARAPRMRQRARRDR